MARLAAESFRRLGAAGTLSARIYYRFLRRVLGGALCLWLHPKSLLRQTGWLKSFRLGRSVDAPGEPIPWNPYFFIRFTEACRVVTFRLRSD